jgi:uncharacterized protein DUF3365
MKQTILICTLSIISALPVSALAAEDRTADERELARQLGIQLKGALVTALQTSPESAIAVCNERAPQITANIGTAHDVTIGRTALRVRNPANRPTAWQQAVLTEFQKRAAAGEPIATLEYSAVVGEGDRAEHRYMKAIPTEPLCVTCHGQKLSPGLQRAIAAKYPEDAATGFNVGDLRGAVYVVRRVGTSPGSR